MSEDQNVRKDVDLMKAFLGSPNHPVSEREFTEFWYTLSAEEQDRLKQLVMKGDSSGRV